MNPLHASEPLHPTPSLRRRMACWLYEGLLLFGLVFVSGYLFGTLSQTRNALDHRHALQAFVFVVCGIYFVWLWSHGQTLAMKTWRIQVVDARGQRITQKRALWRYALCWLWFLPALMLSGWFNLSATATVWTALGWVLLWALSSRLHPDRQFWHDTWAGTRLVSVQD